MSMRDGGKWIQVAVENVFFLPVGWDVCFAAWKPLPGYVLMRAGASGQARACGPQQQNISVTSSWSCSLTDSLETCFGYNCSDEPDFAALCACYRGWNRVVVSGCVQLVSSDKLNVCEQCAVLSRNQALRLLTLSIGYKTMPVHKHIFSLDCVLSIWWDWVQKGGTRELPSHMWSGPANKQAWLLVGNASAGTAKFSILGSSGWLFLLG